MYRYRCEVSNLLFVNKKSGEISLSAEFIPVANIELQKDATHVKLKDSPKEPSHEVDIEVKKLSEKNDPDETITETLVQTSPVLTSKKLLEKGKISITIYKARNIEKKGMFGKADPYVKIMLDAQKAKSTTVKDNHNPELNFTSTFDVDKNTTEKMKIEVFDEDLGKDDSLGSTSLDIGTIQSHMKLLNQWVPLENCKSGESLLSAEFIPSWMAETKRAYTSCYCREYKRDWSSSRSR